MCGDVADVVAGERSVCVDVVGIGADAAAAGADAVDGSRMASPGLDTAAAAVSVDGSCRRSQG